MNKREARMSQRQGRGPPTASPPDNAFDLMCHKMMHSWQLPLYCSTQGKKALAPLSPAHMRSDEHKHIKKKKSNQNKTSLLPFARTAWASLQPVEHKAEIRWIKAPCLSLYLPSKMSTIQGVLGSGSNQIPLLYQSVRPLIPFDTTSFH